MAEETGVRMWRPAAVPEILRVVHLARQTRARTTYCEGYVVGAVTHGRYEGWYRGAVHTLASGQVSLKDPGEVHRGVRVHEEYSIQVAVFDRDAIARAARAVDAGESVHFRVATLDASSRAGALVFAMHDALSRDDDLEAGTLAAEVLTEVVLAAGQPHAPRLFPRAVRRARELLHESYATTVTLDGLAEYAELDKFHLVRAFRAAIGLPPYAYLTHVRVERATALLVRGASVAAAAQAVGFYDESQLHRHFRRLMRITPGRFARMVGGRSRQHRPRHEGYAGVSIDS